MSEKENLRVLVLGATGMLGSTIFRAFSADHNVVTFGSVRDPAGVRAFPENVRNALVSNIDLNTEMGLLSIFSVAKFDVVVNCVGIIKQLPNANDHISALSINSLLPHRLAKYCEMIGARLVHFSTDCVFSGREGGYTEEDFADAYDLYGRTKYLGEVDYENAVTLRTSIIGHELASARSLVDWFLSQSMPIRGYQKAIFSGLPTVEVARVVKDLVIPNPHLKGVYHLSVDPISKYELLRLVAATYGSDIEIIPDDTVVIDRSLNSDRFRSATGYAPDPWPELIQAMHRDYRAHVARSN